MGIGKQNHRVQKLGEMLLTCHLINKQQLDEALKLQNQTGERLGSTLVELDYLTVDALLEFLGKWYGLPTANLFKLNVHPKILALLPIDKMSKYQALPLGAASQKIQMAMVDPNNMEALRELQFVLGTSVQPLVTPSFQMTAALKSLEKSGGKPKEALSGADLAKKFQEKPKKNRLLGINELFRNLLEKGVSDLLLVAGVPPTIKKNGVLSRLPAPFLTPQQVDEYARALMTDSQKEKFARTKELDFSYTLPELGRFRINTYKQRNSVSIAVRYIIEDIPSLGELGLPSWVEDYALKSQGLILITGPNGHGKTTTLSTLVDIINTKRKRNIITIEDPIEYLHRHKASNVNQREVGVDTESFREGLRHIFREAPDVIVIGEMRDPESFAVALQAADTGHLVLSCLHSNNAPFTIDRIVNIFPPEQQQQIRIQLAENLLLILNQRLVTDKNGENRILAYEKLSNSHRVRNLIKKGKEHQIRGLLQQSMDDFQSLDVSLAQLCTEKRITFEAALQYCQDIKFFKDLVSMGRARLFSERDPVDNLQ